MDFGLYYTDSRGFPGGTRVKNPPANVGDTRDEDSTPGLRRSPAGSTAGSVTHSNILAWRIPWTEEPGGLPSIGSQRVRQD